MTYACDMIILPKLPKLMACRGKTWVDVMDVLGLQDRQSQKISKGTENIKILQAIELARLLEVSIGDLIGEEGPPPVEAGAAAAVRYHLRQARAVLESTDDEAAANLIGAIEATYKDAKQRGKPDPVISQRADEVAEE